MLGLVLLSLPVGFLLALPLTALLVKTGRRMGAVDSPGVSGHEKVLRDVPNIGGIAIMFATLGPLLVMLCVLLVMGEEVTEWIPVLEPFAVRLSSQQNIWWAIIIGALVMHAVGLMDDRRPISALPKLLLQILVALGVVFLGEIRLLTALDTFGPMGIALSGFLTVIWIVLITNAINFLDNMDGLAGGVAAIAAAVFMSATIINGQFFTAGAFGLLCGALMGFLVFNVAPARIFMGDCGSLVVGFLLAALTVRTTFVDTADPDFALGSAWYGVLMPLMVLAIPLYDLVSVSILRIGQGRSPMRGDQQHLSHRLLDLGLSRRGSVLVIWALALSTGVGGIVLGSLKPWQAVMIGAQTLAILFVLGLLEMGARRGNTR